MGISISYRGRLRDLGSVPTIVHRMQRVASTMGWPCMDMDELLAKHLHPSCRSLRGLSVQPHPRSEWLHLHVDPDGRLVNHWYWALANDAAHAAQFHASLQENHAQVEKLIGRKPRVKTVAGLRVETVNLAAVNINVADGIGYNWVKTQFGGAVAHVGVCGVLAWLAQYADLKINDDTGYYAHRNLGRLERSLSEVEAWIARLGGERTPSSLVHPIDVIARLERALNEPSS